MVVVAAVIERLEALNMPGGTWAVFDAPPVRGGVPYALAEEPVLADWSGVGWEGRDGRMTVSVHDAGERPVRLRALSDGVIETLSLLPVELGDGWRLIRFRLAKARVAKSGGDRWTASLEYAVRIARVDKK